MKKMFKFAAYLFMTALIAASLLISNISAVETVTGEEDIENNGFSVFSININEPSVYVFGEQTVTLYRASVNIDFNGDGRCTALEARRVLRIAAQIDEYDGPAHALDMTGDGKVTAADARSILRYSASLDVYMLTCDLQRLDGVATDAQTGGSYLFKQGIIASGFHTIDGATYYFTASDGMAKGLVSVAGKTYYFGDDGRAYSGKLTLSGKSYLFENGKAHTGEYREDGKLYYYNSDGSMKTSGTLELGGVFYVFAANGVATQTKDPSTYKIAMIGDSTVLNMYLNNPTERIDFYGRVSLHAYDIFSKNMQGSSRTIIDEVKNRGYDVVIIHVGVNDLGGSESSWGETYRKIISGVKERAPGAIIYASAILPVNEQVARANGYVCTNAQIAVRNATIARIASEESVRYLDATQHLAPSGQLPANAASDGIHFYGSTCKKWAAWILDTVCKF